MGAQADTAAMVVPEALAGAAQSLVDALAQNDGERAADALAELTRLDGQHLRARLGRLAQVLHERVAGLPATVADGTLRNGAEAVHSLDHVSELTEAAAHRTLDLVEQGQALVDCLETSSDHATACIELRGIFGELALAQGYQDLTGQILRRVRGLLQGLETSLTTLAGDADPIRADGPAVPGVDAARSSQADADDLLAELGL